MHKHQGIEVLSLECAFDWLNFHYPSIHASIVGVIAEDQQESLPLNWAVLMEDWDHTYWIAWIFTVWLLWARDGESFLLRHENIAHWMIQMNE